MRLDIFSVMGVVLLKRWADGEHPSFTARQRQWFDFFPGELCTGETQPDDQLLTSS